MKRCARGRREGRFADCNHSWRSWCWFLVLHERLMYGVFLYDMGIRRGIGKKPHGHTWLFTESQQANVQRLSHIKALFLFYISQIAMQQRSSRSRMLRQTPTLRTMSLGSLRKQSSRVSTLSAWRATEQVYELNRVTDRGLQIWVRHSASWLCTKGSMVFRYSALPPFFFSPISPASAGSLFNSVADT